MQAKRGRDEYSASRSCEKTDNTVAYAAPTWGFQTETLVSDKQGKDGAVLVSNKQGKDGVVLVSNKQGKDGVVLVSDKQGKDGAVLVSDKQGKDGVLQVSDKQGEDAVVNDCNMHVNKDVEFQQRTEPGNNNKANNYAKTNTDLDDNQKIQLKDVGHAESKSDTDKHPPGLEKLATHSSETKNSQHNDLHQQPLQQDKKRNEKTERQFSGGIKEEKTQLNEKTTESPKISSRNFAASRITSNNGQYKHVIEYFRSTPTDSCDSTPGTPMHVAVGSWGEGLVGTSTHDLHDLGEVTSRGIQVRVQSSAAQNKDIVVVSSSPVPLQPEVVFRVDEKHSDNKNICSGWRSGCLCGTCIAEKHRERAALKIQKFIRGHQVISCY